MSNFNWLAHKKGYQGWFAEDGHVPGSQGGSPDLYNKKRKKVSDHMDEKSVDESIKVFKSAVSRMKDYQDYQETGDPNLKDKLEKDQGTIVDRYARLFLLDKDNVDAYMDYIPKDRQKEVSREYEYSKNEGDYSSTHEFNRKSTEEEKYNVSKINAFKENQKDSTNEEKKYNASKINTFKENQKDSTNEENQKDSINEERRKSLTSSQLKDSANHFRLAAKGANDISSGFDKAYTHLHTAKNEKEDRSKKVESLSNEELRRVIERIRLNEEYNRVTSKKKSDGYHKTMAALAVLGSAATVTATGLSIAAGIKQLKNK